MSEKENQEDFAMLLVKWYSEQKKVSKDPNISDKGENNVRKET